MSSTPQSSNPSLGWRDLLGVVGPLVGFLSVLGYGIARVSYDRFYDQFGLVPDDVGANSSRVLGESGAHLLVYSFLFAIVPYALTFVVFRILSSYSPQPAWRRLLVTAVSLLPLAAYQRLTGGGIVGAYVGVSTVGLLVIAWWTRRYTRRSPNWWRVGLIWLALGVFWVNLFYVPSAAARAGRCVAQRGLALHLVHTRRHFPGLQHPAVLGLRAQPVEVEWLGSSTLRPALGHALVYLGAAGGTVILFDRTARTTDRLPAGDLVIRLRPGTTLCPELD